MPKRNVFLVTIILFVILTQHIQTLNAQTWIGLRQGIGVSKGFFYLKGLKEQEYPIAFSSGFLFQHYSEKHAGIQIELNYCHKGWKEIDTSYYRKCDISYIELPLMTQLRMGGKKVKFIISAGSLIGYGFQTKEDINYKIKDEPKSYKFKSFEFAITGGIGINLNTNIGAFQLEAKYTHGLLNAIKAEDVVPATGYAQIQYLDISLAYMFLIKLKKTKTKKF